jgi:hypothetical protein
MGGRGGKGRAAAPSADVVDDIDDIDVSPDQAPDPLAGDAATEQDATDREDVQARILATYGNLVSRPGGWVGLALLRAALPDVPRHEFDRALLDLDLDPQVYLIPEVNQKALTSEDRAAALFVGGEEKHLLSVKGAVTTRTSDPLADALSEATATGDATEDAESRMVAVQGRIEAVFRDLVSHPKGWVGLARLRAALPDVSREEFNEALLALDLNPHVYVIPEVNQKALTPEDRAAAIHVGGEDKHLLAIHPSRDAAPAAAPGMDDGPVTAPTEQDDSATDQDLVRDAIRRAITAPEGTWQRLADVRAALPSDLSRADVDAVLKQMSREGAITLAPNPDRKALRQSDHDNAITIGGDHNHLVYRNPQEHEGPADTAPQGLSDRRDDIRAETSRHEQEERHEKPKPVSGALSDKALLDNGWGDLARPDAPISYHDDGLIGSAVKDMGADARMDIDGEPLANVVGKVATDVVMGRRTAQDGVDTYKALRDRLPPDSDARRRLDTAIRRMDAPPAPPPQLPPRTPEPLRQLVADLNKVPVARAEPEKELDKIRKLAEDFAAGSRMAQGRRLIQAVEQLTGARHESEGDAGKFEIDRAVARAVETMRGMPSAELLSEAPLPTPSPPPDTGQPQTRQPTPARRVVDTPHPAGPAGVAARLRETATEQDGAAYLRDQGLSRERLLAVARELGLSRVDTLSHTELEKRVLKQAIGARNKFAGLRNW